MKEEEIVEILYNYFNERESEKEKLKLNFKKKKV